MIAGATSDDQSEPWTGQGLVKKRPKVRLKIVGPNGVHMLDAADPGDPLDVERRRRPAPGITRRRRDGAGSPR